jgi:hypothetical protein
MMMSWEMKCPALTTNSIKFKEKIYLLLDNNSWQIPRRRKLKVTNSMSLSVKKL